MNEESLKKRRRFEALLQEALKQVARSPVKQGGAAIPEVPTTFREGFKWAMVVLEVMEESTTELNDEMMDIINDRMHHLLHEPPPPNEQYPQEA